MPRLGSMLSFAVCCLAMASRVLSQETAQEDDILLVRSAPGDEKLVRYVGQVIELTSEQAILVPKGSTSERKIPLSRVVEFEPRRSGDEQEGRRRLAGCEFEAAVPLLEKARSSEKLTWRKQELEALIAQCEVGQGNFDAAGKRMAAIVKEDADSRLLGYLPLAWMESFKTPSEVSLLAWAKDASPAMKLTAASWMLGGEKRKEAAAQLEKLASGPSPRIAALAEAQLWRTKLATATPLDAQRWLDRIATYAEDLRAGPYFLAGQAAARAKLPKRAAEAWMRIAILYPVQNPLAAEARYLAAGQLEVAGAKADAISLFEQIAAQPEAFPHRNEAVGVLAKLRGAAK